MGNGIVLKGMKVRVNEANIAAMTASPRGIVVKYTRQVVTETKFIAAEITRAGTVKYGRGKLAGAYTVATGTMGAQRCTVLLKNRRPYAAYVFRGTTGPIRSTKGTLLPVGKSQLGLGAIRAPRGAIKLKKKVRGQKGHNYPMNAVREVFLRRGL